MAFGITADRAAAARKAVIFCCDQAYLPYATHAASRIAALHPDRDFDICLCYAERPVTLPESLLGLGIRRVRIDVGDLFRGLRLDAGKSADVYLRLALPEALAADYDRILYLDSDIFVQEGDFSRLLDLDLGAHPLGAVRDNIQWRTPGRRADQFRRLGLSAAPYFNAGVLLMDVARYNASGLLERCVDLGRREAGRMIRHDQNLYNAVLHGDWAELSPVWNWQYSWAARFFADVQGPSIVHFIGSTKPWKDRIGEYPPRFRQSYARFMKSHFPELPLPFVPARQIAPDSRRMLQMLLKHLVSARAMGRYLAKFPDAWTVLK